MAPAHFRSLADDDIEGYGGNQEGSKTIPVKGSGIFLFHPAFRGAVDEGKACDGYEDGGKEDVSPAKGAGYESAEKGTESAPTPGAHGEIGKGTLPRRAFKVILHQGQGGGHDAGRRETLDDPSCHEKYGGSGRSEGNQKGADSGEDNAGEGHFHPANPVPQPSQDYDKESREKGGHANGHIAPGFFDSKVSPHGRHHI